MTAPNQRAEVDAADQARERMHDIAVAVRWRSNVTYPSPPPPIAHWVLDAMHQYAAEQVSAALAAERAAMPTMWEDPAGKGYPCFERPMTAAEARAALVAADAREERLRGALDKLFAQALQSDVNDRANEYGLEAIAVARAALSVEGVGR